MLDTHVSGGPGDAALLVYGASLLLRPAERLLGLSRNRLLGPENLSPYIVHRFSASKSRSERFNILTECGVKAVDVGEETSRDAVLLVELDGALEDLVGEDVALGEVLGGDFAERAV